MAISIVATAISGTAIDGLDVTLDLTTITGLAQDDVVFVISGVTRIDAGAGTSSSGWTSISGPIQNIDIRGQIFRKVMGATPDTSFVATGSANAVDATIAIAIALRGVDTTTPEDATPTTKVDTQSTNPDAVAITTVTNGAWVLDFAISRVNDAAITAPSGYSNKISDTIADTRALSGAVATILKATAGAEDPPAYTTWLSARWATFTVAVRPAGASDQTVTGALFTETNTFFASSLNATNAITGALFTDADTFFASTVTQIQNITGTLFTDADTFFASTLTSSYAISGALFTDTDTFFGATILATNAITGALFTDSDTFFGSTVTSAYTITGALYTDTDTFFTSTVSLPAGGDQTVTGALYTDADTFFSASVTTAYLITGTLYSDPDIFHSALISSSYTISATRYDDVDTFFSSTVTGGAPISGGHLGNLPLWIRRRRRSGFNGPA